jgi:putative peptidoglycan lipid II flippase
VWVPWTVPGFPTRQVVETIEIARVVLAASLAGVYALVLAARMQANSEFALNALAAVLAAGVATVFAVMAIGRFGIVAAAWSLVLKSILQFTIAWLLRPPLIRERYAGDVVLGRRAGPLLASASISKLEPLVDRSLLTTAPPGFLTLFYLAQQVYGAMSQVVAGSLLAHVLTRFSDESRGTNGKPRWSTVRQELIRAALIGAGFWLLLVGSMLVAALLVDSLCPRCSAFLGRPDLENLARLGAALGGVWFFGLQGSVLASFFYSQGDTKTPSLVAIVGFVTAVGLKVAGFRIAGPLGLAIASSVYFFSTSAAMFVIVRLRLARNA